MLPASTPQNVLNRAESNGIALGQSWLADATRCILTTHRADLSLSQLRQPLLFAMPTPTFVDHVSDVVGVGSQIQMVWPDACPHIASVQDPLARGNSAVFELPRNTMRTNVAVRHAHDAVARRVEGASPQPARRRFVDSAPESRLERARSSVEHDQVGVVSVRRRAKTSLLLRQCRS